MTIPHILFTGSPRWGQPSVAKPAGNAREPSAPLSAWCAALTEGPEACRRVTAAMSGDFAVGLHDPVLGRTFIAVDRFAVHTLCYRVRDGALQFAERADALADAGTPLDPQAVFDYLYFHCIPSPRTIFDGVLRLPPGHYGWFETGQLRVAPYWVPTFHEPRGRADFGELRQEFRDKVQKAVERQLDGSVPACFLSGGTDSSTVAGLIGEVAGRPARTYSIGFEAEGYDEMVFARIAARHFGTDHHEYYVTPDDLVAGVSQVAQSYDQPFGNSSALPAYYCAKIAHDQGISRLLAGDGGDELFGGNARYAKQRVFGWYQFVPQLLRQGLLQPALNDTPIGRQPGLSKARSYVQQAAAPMPDRLEMYNLLLRLGIAEVLEPDFLARVDPVAPLRLQREVWVAAQAANELDRTLAFDWRFTLAENDLPKVRGTTTLAGVSVGFPFLDDAVLELSCRLPADYKLKGLKLRWFFKEALRGFLPDEIIKKRKQGFGLPFGVWATRHAGLKALATDSLSTLAERGIVRPAFIRTLLDQRLAEHPGYYGEMVWILMMLEQWLRGRSGLGQRPFR